MRYFLPLFFIFPLVADQMALSVDEAFPDPYAPYYDCNECYDEDEEYFDDYDCIESDVDTTWLYDDEQRYPGRNTDHFMDELTQPWQ